jgi:hypothetical protein
MGRGEIILCCTRVVNSRTSRNNQSVNLDPGPCQLLQSVHKGQLSIADQENHYQIIGYIYRSLIRNKPVMFSCVIVYQSIRQLQTCTG